MGEYNKEIVQQYFLEMGLPNPTFELKFAPPRKFAFDISFPEYRVALEVEGLNGRHQRTAGFLQDMEKYNYASLLGWRLIRCTPDVVCMDFTVATLKQLIENVKTNKWD